MIDLARSHSTPGEALRPGRIRRLQFSIPFTQNSAWSPQSTPAWVTGQFISSIGLRLLIVWLYNNTGKSILAAILFHDMINVSEFLFPNYSSHYDPVIAAAITVVIAVIVTFLWDPKTLARYKFYGYKKQKIAHDTNK